MNNHRRKRLQEALTLIDQADSLLTSAVDIVQEVRDEEQEAFENMPESFQDGEKGQRMQEIIDTLDEISFEDAIEEAKSSITETIE